MPPETNDSQTQVAENQNKSSLAIDIKDLYEKFSAKENSNGMTVAPAPEFKNVPSAGVTDDGSIVFDAQQGTTPSEVQETSDGVRADGDTVEEFPTGKVTKDDQGRVVQVEYPNGTSRQFGYGEDGKLNQITQPDGTVLELKDGKWVVAPRKPVDDGHAPPAPPSDGTGSGGSPGGKGSKGKGGHQSDQQSDPGPKDGTSLDDEGKDKATGIAEALGAMMKGSVDMVDPEVSEDGTFTYHTRDGNEVKIFASGTSWIHDEKTGYYVNKDADGRVDSIVSPHAQVSQFHYDQDGQLDTYTENGTSYYRKDGKWTTADGKPAPITNIDVTDKGVVYYENVDSGQKVERRPDGTKTLTNINGSRLEVNAEGQTTSFRSADGMTTRDYEYKDGKLQSVKDNNGNSFTANTDGTWTDKDGNKITNFKAEADGSLSYTDKDGHIVVSNTDGHTTTTTMTEQQLKEVAHSMHDVLSLPGFATGFFAGGINEQIRNMSPEDRLALQQEYEKTNGSKLTDDLVKTLGWDKAGDALVSLETANVMDHAARTMPERERQEFLNNLNTFMDRAAKQGLSQEEIARTLHATDRMLTATDGKVDGNLRRILAEQMMANAANPAGIDQGGHLTCNVTDVEVVTWSKSPGVAAEMIADMALNGEWTAPDGNVVTIPPQNFLPQEGSYDSASSDDRTFASQLFQATTLSDWGSRQKPPIYYMQGQPDAQNHTGEYWTDKDGNFIMEKDKEGNEAPKEFAGWGIESIAEALRRLNGDNTAMFANRQVTHSDHLTTFSNEKEFREALEKAKKEGKMPIVLYVASGDPIFGGSGKPGEDGHRLNHVVCIDDYNPVTGQVRVNNSWGDSDDKWVNIADVYRATLR